MASINDILSSKPHDQEEQEAEKESMQLEVDEPTPEEQEAYDNYTHAGIKMVSKMTPQIANMAEKSPDSAKALSEISLNIISAVMAKSPQPIDEDVLLSGADDIVTAVAEVFDSVGQLTEQDYLNGLGSTLMGLADHLGVEISQEEAMSLINQVDEKDLKEMQKLAGGQNGATG